MLLGDAAHPTLQSLAQGACGLAANFPASFTTAQPLRRETGIPYRSSMRFAM